MVLIVCVVLVLFTVVSCVEHVYKHNDTVDSVFTFWLSLGPLCLHARNHLDRLSPGSDSGVEKPRLIPILVADFTSSSDNVVIGLLAPDNVVRY